MEKSIVIHSGLAWETWQPDSLYTTGLGGSEIWAIRLAECLANSNKVIVFGPMENQIHNKVQYKNLKDWDTYQEAIDILIISRYPQFLQHNKSVKKTLLMVHDIFPIQDNGQTKHYIECGKLDVVICLSTWHRDFVANYCKIDKERIRVIGNGIDI